MAGTGLSTETEDKWPSVSDFELYLANDQFDFVPLFNSSIANNERTSDETHESNLNLNPPKIHPSIKSYGTSSALANTKSAIDNANNGTADDWDWGCNWTYDTESVTESARNENPIVPIIETDGKTSSAPVNTENAVHPNSKLDRNYQTEFPLETETESQSESESASNFNQNYDFVCIRDVPTKPEFSARMGPSLNPMPMKGSHTSALNYLNDVYRLLREDFVGPIREYFNTMHKRGIGVYPNIGLRFYHGVQFDIDTNPIITELELQRTSCNLRFVPPVPYLTEEEWEENGWLLPESLVILSSDNFRTIYIATVVWNKKNNLLSEGYLTIAWEGSRPPLLMGVTFVMAESEAYFAAYRHNLKALQVMAQPVPVPVRDPGLDMAVTTIPLFATYPMAKYIVDMSTEHVPPPKYLRHTPHLLNFSALMKHNPERYASPLHLASWPRTAEIELDEAQFAAFQSAVTQELSIIQGPPGTGKTYIGLQLMKLFLSNPKIFTSPILIVCRTNHALDQFLEGLLPVMKNLNLPLKQNLIRIGGGSKSVLLEEYVWKTRSVLNDLQRLSEFQSDPVPSHEINSITLSDPELESLEKECSDILELLEKLRQVNSVAEFARLAQNSRGLKDLLDPTSPIDIQSSLSSFITLGERYLLDQIAVLNVKACILRDQAKFHANSGAQQQQLISELTGKVIGMTTTGAAKYTKWVRCMQPKIVIVEEAAEVLESHVVTSITEHCEHLILIGDHKQLRPFTKVHRLAQEFHLDISLFERLIHNDHSWCCLETQHRMRPEICKLLVPTIYETLKDHSDVLNYPNVAGFKKNLFFINHQEYELVNEDSVSKINVYEALYVAGLCRHLVLQNYDPSRVTILITYNGQKGLVAQLIKALGEPFSEVKVETVDSYQGEENDIIIVSLVRSNPENKIGFLSIENRICVALSRARHGLYILGNMDCLTKAQSRMWSQISGELHKQDSIGNQLELKCQIHGTEYQVDRPEDFHSKAPDGGCSLPCDFLLPNCSHRCPKFCHVVDMKHEREYKCTVKLPIVFPCGHVHQMDCHVLRGVLLNINYVYCNFICGAVLSCGHFCPEKCHGNIHINYICGICTQLKYNYYYYQNLFGVSRYCGINPQAISNQMRPRTCAQSCSLGHPCLTPHKSSRICPPCHVRINQKLPCGHERRNVTCRSLTPLEGRTTCNARCNKTLPLCKHPCPKTCHSNSNSNSKEVHRSYKCEVVVDMELSCGHFKELPCHETTRSASAIDQVTCESQCGAQLDCGHFCAANCQGSQGHGGKNCVCREDCIQICDMGHPCTTKHPCGTVCPPCTLTSTKQLQCGHDIQNVICTATATLLTFPCPVCTKSWDASLGGNAIFQREALLVDNAIILGNTPGPAPFLPHLFFTILLMLVCCGAIGFCLLMVCFHHLAQGIMYKIQNAWRAKIEIRN